MAKQKPFTGGGELLLGRPNPKQIEFFESEALYTCFGGAKGGGNRGQFRRLRFSKL